MVNIYIDKKRQFSSLRILLIEFESTFDHFKFYFQKLPNANIGFAKAMSNGWLQVDKSSKPPIIKRKVNEF